MRVPAAARPTRPLPGSAASAARRCIRLQGRARTRRRAAARVDLFADLVGFTTLSEPRRAEEVRESSRATSRRARGSSSGYGGAVEKFIGDAVMAVWGAPTANEDDAERAVGRHSTSSPPSRGLADELGLDDLRLRARRAHRRGGRHRSGPSRKAWSPATSWTRVADPVRRGAGNAARRRTRRAVRATEAAIAYEDVGFHAVKGRGASRTASIARAASSPPAARGPRRTASSRRSWVAKREFHGLMKVSSTRANGETASAARSISGIAGIGKSRLS